MERALALHEGQGRLPIPEEFHLRAFKSDLDRGWVTEEECRRSREAIGPGIGKSQNSHQPIRKTSKVGETSTLDLPFCLLFLPPLALFEANMREPFCRELTKTMENNLLLERIVERSMVGLLNIQCTFPSFSSQKPSAFQFIHHVAPDAHLISPLL